MVSGNNKVIRRQQPGRAVKFSVNDSSSFDISATGTNAARNLRKDGNSVSSRTETINNQYGTSELTTIEGKRKGITTTNFLS